MTFTAGIPQDGQTLGSSKPQVRNNFTNLFNTFAIDHVNGNDITHPGRHNLSSYVAQGSDPATAANICAIYSKIVGGVPQLYFRQQSSGTVYQMTGTSSSATSIPSVAANGYTYLPGGLILQWFNVIPTGALQNYPTAFPNNCFAIIGGQTTTTGSVTAIASSKTQFTAKASNGAILCYFIAIGN